MQRRNVKYGVSLVTIIAIIVKMKSFIRSNQDKKRAQEQYSKRIEELEMMEERKRALQDIA